MRLRDLTLDGGFFAPVGIVAVAAACCLAAAGAFLTQGVSKRIAAERRRLESLKEADSALSALAARIQSLAKDAADDGAGENYLALGTFFADYSLELRDVSTAVNAVLAPESVLKNAEIQRLLETGGEKFETRWGWANANQMPKGFAAKAKEDFGAKDDGALFPIVNEMPLWNVFAMEGDFLRAALSAVGVSPAEGKASAVAEALSAGVRSKKDLAAALDLPESHVLFDLVGFKTAFWKAEVSGDDWTAEAVFAAVPRKSGGGKAAAEIERYVVLEKRVEIGK